MSTARPDGSHLTYRYSVSSDEIHDLACAALDTFRQANPTATTAEIETFAGQVAHDLTPPVSNTRQLLELALQDEDLFRRPLPAFMAECGSGGMLPSLSVFLRTVYSSQLVHDLLEHADVLDALLAEEETLRYEEEPEPLAAQPLSAESAHIDRVLLKVESDFRLGTESA